MKIRMNKFSIRFRLSKSEVEKFGNEGNLSESIVFDNNTFKYVLQLKGQLTGLTVSYCDNTITLFVPETLGKEWVSTGMVGIENIYETTGGNVLTLLLEKDYKCIGKEENDDQSDNFDNPEANCN